MKRLFAALLGLVILCGCAASPAAARPEDAKVSLRLVEVGSNEATFEVSVDWNGTPSGYGYVLYDFIGSALKEGQSDSPTITIDGLSPGDSYSVSAWAQVGDDKKIAVKSIVFETDLRFSGAVAKGIDVSRWQESIDWQLVAADGVDFAILRIGYTGGIDRNFEEYYEGATRAGLDVGVYLYSYATTIEQAKSDAELVLDQLNDRPLSYPIFYDIEDECQDVLTRDQLTAVAAAFCDEIERSGYKTGVYASRYTFVDRLDEAQLCDRYELWMAEVADAPPESTNYQIVQHSHTGRVDGIDGDVDLNTAYVKYN